jgi:hypothetical protein
LSIRKTNNNNRHRGKAFENKMAKYFGWIRVPYSGSAEAYGLGDLRDHEDQQKTRYMAECKSITPRSAKEINYTVQEKWLVGKDSIVARAKKQGNKFPVLLLTKVRSSLTFAIMREKDFKMMVDALEVMRRHGLIDNTTDVDKIREQIAGHFPAQEGEAILDQIIESNTDESVDDERS